MAVPALLEWAFFEADFNAANAQECRASGGACWAFIIEKHRLILFGTLSVRRAMASADRHHHPGGRDHLQRHPALLELEAGRHLDRGPDGRCAADVGRRVRPDLRAKTRAGAACR